VQNPLPCLPCEKLGCEGHLDSYSRCLDELPLRSVLKVVDEALGRSPPSGARQDMQEVRDSLSLPPETAKS